MPTKEDISVEIPDRDIIKSNGKTHLFFIAIDKYKNGIRPLNNPVKDAKAIARCLLDHYDFDENLLIELYNNDATQEAIEEQFNTYLNELTSNDNLILFFSGHGDYSENKRRGYWLTAESIRGKKSTFYSNSEVIDFIGALKANHFYGIVDACFSGALFTARSISSLNSRHFGYPSRQILTSGRLEKVDDGPEHGHSPFADALITELKFQRNEFLKGSILNINIENNFAFEALDQTPRGGVIRSVGDQGGDFIFLKKGYSLTGFNSDKIETLVKDNSPSKRDSTSSILDINESNLQLNLKDIRSIIYKKMELKELANTVREYIEKNQFKQAFELLKDQLDDNSDKRRNLSLLGRRFNVYMDKILTNTISNKKGKIEISSIGASLFDFVESLEQEDLGKEKHYENVEITNQILVFTNEKDVNNMKVFFLQLNFTNVEVRKYSNDLYDINNYDLVVFDNQDLPVCAFENDLDKLDTNSQTLLISRIEKMESVIKNSSKFIIHFGDRLFWINSNRNRTQSANSKFSLHSRTKEVLEFINTYRV